MKIGIYIKMLRNNKHLSQEYVSENVCSRSYLSKVENGHALPSTNIFFKIIERLDLSVEEFLYLYKKKYSIIDKNKICNTFFNLRDNYSDLDNIIHLSESYLENNRSNIIRDILTVSNILKSLRKQDEIEAGKYSHELSRIWKRLEKIDSLSIYEIRLLANILFLFPLEDALNMSIFVLKSLDKYENYLDIEQIKMVIYVNIGSLSFYNFNFEKSIEFSNMAIDIGKKLNKYDLVLYSSARVSLLENNKKLFSQFKSTLKILGLHSYITELDREEKIYNEQKFN